MRSIIPATFAALALNSYAVSAAAETAETASPPQLAVAPSYLDRARELAMHALSLIGVAYRFGGNTPDAGLDCSGLVSHVFQQVTGIVLPRDSNAMSKVGQQIDKSDLEPGDLVFFNTTRRPFSHVGIYIGQQRFVHAPRPGREVEMVSMSDAYWKKRFDGARRVAY